MASLKSYFNKENGTILSYFLLAFVLFAQIGWMQQPLKWDAIDCFLAWRLNVSEAIRAGEIPWWSAFQHLGFPMHADPDTGALYPVVWIISGVYGYDFYALNFEFCLHVFIAGWGMHRLLRSMHFSLLVSFLISFSFMANGVFVSNAQNFAFLIGMAWFPWVFLTLRNALIRPGWKTGFFLAVAVFMWLSGSYPGVVIIGAYVLAAYIVYFFVSHRQRGLTMIRLSGVDYIFKIAMPVLLICALPVVASVETYGEITRTEGLNAARITENPFPPKAYISWFTPFAVGTRANVEWGSDFSMINMFMGLPFLLGMAGWAVQRRMDKRSFFALITAAVLMIAALGALTPFRMWLAHLPAMGLFRHPSIFRFIAVIFFLLASAGGLEYLLKDAEAKRKRIALGLAGIPFLFLMGYTAPYFSWDALSLMADEWLKRAGESALSFENRVFIQASLFFLLIAALFLTLFRRFVTVVVVLISGVLAVQMNMYATVASEGVLARYNRQLHELTGNRTPYAGESIRPYNMNDTDLGIPVIWRNESIYQRKPGWDGYNSFILRRYNELEESRKLETYAGKSLIFPADTTIQTTFSGWKIGTNEIAVNISGNTENTLILLQTYLPSWKAFVDGKETPLFVYDEAFPGIKIAQGSHQLVFRYEPEFSGYAGVISLVSFIALLGIVTGSCYFQRSAFGRS